MDIDKASIAVDYGREVAYKRWVVLVELRGLDLEDHIEVEIEIGNAFGILQAVVSSARKAVRC